MSLSSPRLPPEILHTLTTSYLSPTTDASTLHALSLTHSFLLASARSALFHTVRLTRHILDDGVHPHLCSSLAALFHRSPHIAGYVRKLVIVEGTIRNSWFSNTRYWVTSEDDDLPFILRMVAYGGGQHAAPGTPKDNWAGIGLRSLEILGFGKSIMDWSSFHPKLHEAFIDVFEKGSLEDLRIVGLNNFPLHALQRTKSLKNMCFGWMDITTSAASLEHESNDVYGSRPELKFLDLSFEHNMAQGTALIDALIQPTCSLNTSHLEHIVINGDQHLNIQDLFNHCQSDLKFLEIRTNEYPIPSPPSHITLHNLSSLHCLSLFVPVIDWDEVNPKPFPWLDHLLSTLRAPSSSSTYATTTNEISNPMLHTLQLIFDIDRIPLFERINHTEWSNLNHQITRLLRSRSSAYNPYTHSFSNSFSVPDLEITIYIFTDLDSYYTSSPSASSFMPAINCSTFLKDPLASYSTTSRSCSCSLKSISSGGNRSSISEDKNGRRGVEEQQESIQLRRFLMRFLPVLGTREGIAGIRVYRINYIPRL